MAFGLAAPAVSPTEPGDDTGRPTQTVSRASDIGRVLPVTTQLTEVLPDRGLRRGTTVSVTGSTALLITLIATASANGAWCAVAGLPRLGLLACVEAGIALERLLLVPELATDWPKAVANLLEGCDITVAAPPKAVPETTASRLTARARTHKTVLIGYGTAWPGADAVLTPTTSTWYGLGQGYGRLRYRELGVKVHGRRAAARPRETTLHLGLPEPSVPAPPRLRAVA